MPMSEAEILDIVRRHLAEILPDVEPDAVRMDQDLANLGASSIDRAEVATMAMSELGIVVPIMEFQHVSNVGTLVGVLRRHI
jgi:polyketide biosynthesis acyl carrier protein